MTFYKTTLLTTRSCQDIFQPTVIPLLIIDNGSLTIAFCAHILSYW